MGAASHGDRSVEDIKRSSRRLRGTLVQSLEDMATGAISADDGALLKFHGSYQQDDRDERDERRKRKLEPDYSFMIRTRTPGGTISPAQWLQLDAVATRWATRGLRATTRQAIQFHGIAKRDLQPALQGINAALIDTIAACGDVNRNIVASTAPLAPRVRAAIAAQAQALSARLLPHSRAYHEIWLGEERVEGAGEEHEPVYGEVYLPRKFKIGFAVPPHNDIDVFAQDLGFVAILDGSGDIAGYDVLVGGGMGATHGDARTYPRLASVVGFVEPAHVATVAEAVVTTQRDWGDRVDRKRARLKYTIDDRGLDTFVAEVSRRAGIAIAPARGFAFAHNGDRFGWIEGAEGRRHLGLKLPAGRVLDGSHGPLQSRLRELALLLSGVHDAGGGNAPEFRLTPNQNLLVANIPATLVDAVARIAATSGLDAHRHATPLRRDALACVALPTCGLAMAEAERYLPGFVDAFQVLLHRHGLDDAAIHLRLSGCPNGCSRPYLAEVALVGKAPGRYNLMLGGDHRGQRLNALYRENVDEPAILAALDPLLADYARARSEGERFGDFVQRTVLAPATQESSR